MTIAVIANTAQYAVDTMFEIERENFPCFSRIGVNKNLYTDKNNDDFIIVKKPEDVRGHLFDQIMLCPDVLIGFCDNAMNCLAACRQNISNLVPDEFQIIQLEEQWVRE